MTRHPLRSGVRPAWLLSLLGVPSADRPPTTVSAPSYCPRCGSPMPADATYCPACGASRATTAQGPPAAFPSPYPARPTSYSAPPPPPRHTGAPVGLIVVIIVVAVVAVSIAAYAIASLMATPTLPPFSGPKAVGVIVTQTPDGTNWTLTFTSVPTGMSPATTYLALMSPSGSTLLPATPLSGMSGMMSMMGSSDRLYMEYSGGMMSTVSAGDTVHIGTTFAGSMTSTVGCQVQISVTGAILYMGTLQ